MLNNLMYVCMCVLDRRMTVISNDYMSAKGVSKHRRAVNQ